MTRITSPRSESIARTYTTHSGSWLARFIFCFPLPNSVFGSAAFVTVKVTFAVSSTKRMITTSFPLAAPSWGCLPVVAGIGHGSNLAATRGTPVRP